MDFAAAERRLARDQASLRADRRKRMAGGPSLSTKEAARREAAKRHAKMEAKKRQEREAQLRMDQANRVMASCDRQLGVVGLGQELVLRPVSVHGDGDKVTLPPAVLDQLMKRDDSEAFFAGSNGRRTPLAVRIGIRNPKYTFPASKSLKDYVETRMTKRSKVAEMEEDDDEEDEEDADDTSSTLPYKDELSERYISYTYGTVVEFTQDDGQIGIPAGVAAALLKDTGLRTTRTVDPAGVSSETPPPTLETDDTAEINEIVPMEQDNDDDDEKTPGHVAWGLFDVPECEVEVRLVTNIPKGTACLITPTQEAIRNGFYGLKDVKLVLEQSLVRTRSTLSVRDVVHTWHRGIKYDLTVSKVTPSDFRVVSCVNTDIEVDFGSPESPSEATHEAETASIEAVRETPTETVTTVSYGGTGYKLSDSPAQSHPPKTAAPAEPAAASVDLLPEPPADVVEGVCTIQIRGKEVPTTDSVNRRRFDIQSATVADLFHFASWLQKGEERGAFRLVTNFPRRVFTQDAGNQTLADAGLSAGRELLMVERT